MILCGKCRKVWPAGTVWCGCCRATLGMRLCDGGHESPLGSRACTTCGSAKLSPGVPSVRLRGCSWLTALGMLLLVGLPLARWGLEGLWRATAFLFDRVTTIFVGLAFLTFVFWFLFTDDTKRLVSDFWLALGRLVIQALFLLGRLALWLGVHLILLPARPKRELHHGPDLHSRRRSR